MPQKTSTRTAPQPKHRPTRILQKGQVVWHEPSPGHVCLGQIEAVASTGYLVRLFDGVEVRVPASDAQDLVPLRNVVARNSARRKWTVKFRTVLGWFFGPRDYQRIRLARRQTIEKALADAAVEAKLPRSADEWVTLVVGASAPPRATPNATDRVTPEPVDRAQAKTPRAIPGAWAELLPRWTERVARPPSSRDPLGFQSGAAVLADRLLPGLTVFTQRAGYYGFLAWALDHAQALHKGAGEWRQPDLIYRLERALATCEFFHHDRDADNQPCAIIGSRRRGPILSSARDGRVPLPERLVRNQAASGCLRLYSSSMVSLGLWEEDDERGAGGGVPYRNTELGKALADRFKTYGGEATEHLLDWARRAGGREVGNVRDWGSTLCLGGIARRGNHGVRGPFLRGLLKAGGPGGEAQEEAYRRWETATALEGAGFLDPETSCSAGTNGSRPATNLLDEPQSLAVLDLELAEQTSGPGNLDVLVHFYSLKAVDGPVREGWLRTGRAAAVHEFVACALNTIWASALDAFRTERKRWIATDLVAWLHLPPQTPQELGRREKRSEAECVGELLVREPSAARSDRGRAAVLAWMTLAKVLTRRRNRELIHSEIRPDGGIAHLTDVVQDLLNRPAPDATRKLLVELVAWHRSVSDDKGKEAWLRLEGEEIVCGDLHDFTVGIHSYRFPQLLSLCRDVKLTREDLSDAGRANQPGGDR